MSRFLSIRCDEISESVNLRIYVRLLQPAVGVVRLVTMLILFSDSSFNAMVTGAWLTVLSVTATGSITLQTVLISVTHRPCSNNASLQYKANTFAKCNLLGWHDCTGMMYISLSVPPLSPSNCPRSPHTGWGDMERGPGLTRPRNLGSGSHHLSPELPPRAHTQLGKRRNPQER